MFPTKKIAKTFRKQSKRISSYYCEHKVLILKESNNFTPFIEQHMIKINKEYYCIDCHKSFKAIPSKMIRKPLTI